jgi:hypothetical protein
MHGSLNLRHGWPSVREPVAGVLGPASIPHSFWVGVAGGAQIVGLDGSSSPGLGGS